MDADLKVGFRFGLVENHFSKILHGQAVEPYRPATSNVISETRSVVEPEKAEIPERSAQLDDKADEDEKSGAGVQIADLIDC